MTSADDCAATCQGLARASGLGTTFFALVDLANVATEADGLRRLFQRSGACCVFGDRAVAAELASPWLIPLETASANDRMLRHTVELARRSSAVTWLLGDLSFAEMTGRLRVRTESRLTQRFDILLRYFDPRVLPVLHAILGPEAREAFFCLGMLWSYLGRGGALENIPLKPAPKTDPFVAPLELADTQAAVLLDAAEIDAVMPEIVKEDPDRFLALGDGPARYQFTLRCLERARHCELHQFPQKVVVCTLALRLGADFEQEPAWQSALKGVASGHSKFGAAIDQVLGEAA